MTKLIGLGGRLTSGKDTVADYLVDNHNWVKLNMSAPLHTAMLALDPWIPVEFQYSSGNKRYSDLVNEVGYTEAKENAEVRRLLQALGTEVGRNMFDPNVWVNIASHNIQELQAQGHSVAITGIRFPNEVDMIHSLDGDLVWVERPQLAPVGAELMAHASEGMGPKDFDIIIENTGTLDDLYEKTEKYLA